ncbi:MAG: TolC family protein [Bacteroidetes bacterium]|nr:TolC family protein [Bacteroidota bacterium]
MDKNSHRLLFLLTGFLIASSLFGQTEWTLDQCISYAQEHNIKIKQLELSVDLAQNNFLQSKLDPLPSINGGVGHTYRFGRSVDPLTYEFTNQNTVGSAFYARSGLDLFKGFQKIHSIKKGRLELDKKLADLDRARNDLALTITRYFLEVMYNQDMLVIAGNQLEISGHQLAQTQILVNAGSLPAGDVLEIESQIAYDELILVNTQNQLDLSFLDLSQLLDIENPENFSILRPDFSNFELSHQAEDPVMVYNQALKTLPRVRFAELAVLSSERDLKIANSHLSPSLYMTSTFGSGYSDQIMDIISGQVMPFYDQIQFASTSSISFSLSIPVFNSWSNRINIKNARLAVLNSQYELELTRNQLRKEIQLAAADARAAMKRFQASNKSSLSLERSFNYTEKKYNLGALTSLDYIIAKNKLVKARSELLQAKYGYIFNSKILDFYNGIPFI